MTDDRPEILVVDDYSSSFPLAETLERWFRVHRLADAMNGSLPPDDVAKRVRALVTTTNCGASGRLIDALPALELVAVTGGHLDTIDREATARREIPVRGTPGVTTADCADLVMGLIIAVLRRIPEGDAFVRAGRWLEQPMARGWRVNGRRLGIVGMGKIGRILARRAEGFDMSVAYAGPSPKPDLPYKHFAELEELARCSDILAVTCKSGPSTRRIVNRAVLRALGPEGVLVTISRGAVDQAAVMAALDAGEIRGAGLDVFEAEPTVPWDLIASRKVVLLAHTGSKTIESKNELVARAIGNVLDHFGLPRENLDAG